MAGDRTRTSSTEVSRPCAPRDDARAPSRRDVRDGPRPEAANRATAVPEALDVRETTVLTGKLRHDPAYRSVHADGLATLRSAEPGRAR